MKHALLAFIILIASLTNAQTSKEIIYLKNGSIIKGRVIEQTGGGIKVKTKDGSIFSYSHADIEKRVNPKQAKKDSIESQRKLYVGFNVCPLMTLTKFREQPTRSPGDYFQNLPAGGFLGGFSFAYQRKNVGFETGLDYRTYGMIEKDWYAGNAIPDQTNQRYHNVEIPFLFNVYSNPAKVRFVGSLGATGDVTLLYTNRLSYLGFDEKYSIFKGRQAGGFLPNQFNYWDCIGVVQAGIEATATPTMIVRVCPMFSYGFFQGPMGGINVEVLFKIKGK